MNVIVIEKKLNIIPNKDIDLLNFTQNEEIIDNNKKNCYIFFHTQKNLLEDDFYYIKQLEEIYNIEINFINIEKIITEVNNFNKNKKILKINNIKEFIKNELISSIKEGHKNGYF